MIIGFVGFISSGKDTAADYLVNTHRFRRDSFANSLKDAISYIFGWDRTLMEGKTKESREWREKVDPWWSTRLNIPHLTPRWIMQYWGTEVLRNHFHDDIWIASLENRMRNTKDNIVISDVRFPNEIKSIHRSGGLVVRIKRGPEPDWYEDAVTMNKGKQNIGWMVAKSKIQDLKIHTSETSWIGQEINHTIVNDGTVLEMFEQLDKVLEIRS